MMKKLPSKSAPVRAGTQKPGTNLVFIGENRKQRRAAEVCAAKPKSLPKSIWRITSVIGGVDDALSVRTYRLRIERDGREDTVLVHTKEGAPPQLNGLLERMQRPTGGEAFIWTDATAAKSSIGGGYTTEAMPAEWSKRSFQNLNLGEPWKDPGHAQTPTTDR